MLAAARGFPLGNQRSQLCPHCHQAQGGFRAVEIVLDLLVHGVLDTHHVGPQNTHFAANFINSVVHGLLEQKENIELSYRCKAGRRKMTAVVTKYGKVAERIGEQMTRAQALKLKALAEEAKSDELSGNKACGVTTAFDFVDQRRAARAPTKLFSGPHCANSAIGAHRILRRAFPPFPRCFIE